MTFRLLILTLEAQRFHSLFSPCAEIGSGRKRDWQCKYIASWICKGGRYKRVWGRRRGHTPDPAHAKGKDAAGAAKEVVEGRESQLGLRLWNPGSAADGRVGPQGSSKTSKDSIPMRSRIGPRPCSLYGTHRANSTPRAGVPVQRSTPSYRHCRASWSVTQRCLCPTLTQTGNKTVNTYLHMATHRMAAIT